MKDIYQIVEDEIHARMDNNIHVSSYSVVDEVITLNVCDVKWSRVGLDITDGSEIVFSITAVNYENNTISMRGLEWTGNGLLQPYKFFVGTPMSTNEEWKEFSNDERNKVPFVWMVEPTSEEIQPIDSDLERISEVRLVFLDDNFARKWITTEVHDNRLKGVYNAVDWFVKAIHNNYLFSFKDSYNIKNFTRFGNETANGFTADIIDADLTGVELRLSLPINKDDNCNC